MEENGSLRGLIETGKGNLQWERDIPPAALSNLESLAAKDFKGNMGQIIHDIYQTAHVMFGDMTLDLYEILGHCTWTAPKPI